MVAFVLVVNILAIGLLIIAIARNLRDAHRAKGKQAVIESLNAECELQKAAATRRLKALDAAAYDLQTAGQLIMLAEDALHISDQLAQILSENATDPKALDLTHPLSRVITSLEMGKTEVLPWQQLRLMSLRDRYNAHRVHVMDRAIPGFESDVRSKSAPLEMTASEIQTMLSKHRMALKGRAETLAKPYIEALRFEGTL